MKRWWVLAISMMLISQSVYAIQVEQSIVISDTFESGNTQLVGASGTHEWVIKIISPGIYKLVFSKQRPWEKEAIETTIVVLNALEKTKLTKD